MPFPIIHAVSMIYRYEVHFDSLKAKAVFASKVLLIKFFPSSSLILYSLEVNHYRQPTLQGLGVSYNSLRIVST